MARLIENGIRVTCAAFSTAAKSVPEGFPKDVLKHEVRAATGVLGIPEATSRSTTSRSARSRPSGRTSSRR